MTDTLAQAVARLFNWQRCGLSLTTGAGFCFSVRSNTDHKTPENEFSESIKKGWIEFCESIKKGLPLVDKLGYVYPAPHKTGAGRGNPCKLSATPDAASVFFVVRYTRHSMAWCAYLMAGCSQAPDHATAHRAALIMVTLAGLPKGRPVPDNAGISTPVNVTAPIERGNSSGDSVNLLSEAVYHG
ncbi:ash family protein [Salmonella enterica]|nr:ash family protein [Salmonella enterica]